MIRNAKERKLFEIEGAQFVAANVSTASAGIIKPNDVRDAALISARQPGLILLDEVTNNI